jgi:hypothetical protein
MTARAALATALTATAILAPAAQAMVPGDDGAPAPNPPTLTHQQRHARGPAAHANASRAVHATHRVKTANKIVVSTPDQFQVVRNDI